MSTVDFSRLRQLWAGRKRATESEWAELFSLVERVLRRAKILDGLDREDLVQGYFMDRVMAGQGKSVPAHEGALLGWFRNYQLDQVAKDHTVDVELDDAFCAAVGLSTDATEIDEVLFSDHRAAKVDTFFEGLSDDERLLIQVSHCDDASVKSVKDQYLIKSAHYKVKRLGVVLGKKTLPATWAKTKIGRLVLDLGLKIERGVSADLLQVFRLICIRALMWWETRT